MAGKRLVLANPAEPGAEGGSERGMKKPPTLIDALYRASFAKERNPGWTDNGLWRDALFRAKKFVLDDAMSTFLGELGTQAFVAKRHNSAVSNRICEHLRMIREVNEVNPGVKYRAQEFDVSLLARA